MTEGPRDLRRIRRLAGRHRRVLAATCAAASVTCTIIAVRTPAAGTAPADGTVRVLAAGRDLAAGTPVRAADAAAVALPRRAVPDGALRAPVARLDGRRLAGAMRRGEPFTDAAFAPAEGPGGMPAPGTVAAPVRVADAATAALVRPGDRVDVLAAPSGETSTASEPESDGPPAPGGAGPTAESVAEAVRVVDVPRQASGVEEGALIVVEATRAQAKALAAAAARTRLSVVITRPPG